MFYLYCGFLLFFFLVLKKLIGERILKGISCYFTEDCTSVSPTESKLWCVLVRVEILILAVFYLLYG